MLGYEMCVPLHRALKNKENLTHTFSPCARKLQHVTPILVKEQTASTYAGIGVGVPIDVWSNSGLVVLDVLRLLLHEVKERRRCVRGTQTCKINL